MSEEGEVDMGTQVAGVRKDQAGDSPCCTIARVAEQGA